MAKQRITDPKRGAARSAARGSHASGGERRTGGSRETAGRASADRGLLDVQRARILGALVEVVRERGVGRITIADVVSCSGVSRRTFYETFEDREACLLAAFESGVARAAARVAPTVEPASPWHTRIRSGLAALLEFIDAEPELGAFCVVDALAAGPAVLELRAMVLNRLVDAVDEARSESRASVPPTRLTAEGAVGAVLAVLFGRLSAPSSDGEREPLVGLLNSLTAMVVLPYLGSAAAAREMRRSLPTARSQTAHGAGNPLAGLRMRLTYRTACVLTAVAVNPDASNRAVASVAGVQDQGQISKLLARLESLGLIRNIGSSASKGEPNRWRLTTRGEQVEGAIRMHSTTGHRQVA